ncbi:hypothetical protein [Streptomyces sp. NBC_01210]
MFVNSISDLFHARVPLDFVRQVFEGHGRHAAAYVPGADEAGQA